MEWFVLTTVFTDQAYKSCESGGCKKVKKIKKCRFKIMQEMQWRSGGACRIYCRGSHFLGGQSELHKRTLLANSCSRAPEPANLCDSFDRVDNHRWRLLLRYLLLSFIFHVAFTVNNCQPRRKKKKQIQSFAVSQFMARWLSCNHHLFRHASPDLIILIFVQSNLLILCLFLLCAMRWCQPRTIT